MENIKLSVRELVDFVYKSGDLTAKGFSTERALEGINAHKTLQSQMGENYQKEFFLKYEFEFDNIFFTIEGRADGILNDGGSIIVDEIKSTYKSLELLTDDYNITHISQAKCYAFIYGIQNKIDELIIQLRYYNLDTKETKKFTYIFKLDELKTFFYGLIHYYIAWAKKIIVFNQLKKESIDKIEFPFANYRRGQREFSVAVYRTITGGKRLFAQAPTGVGKTISVLFPAIKSLNYVNNAKIFYLTAKSSTKSIAYDTIKMMADRGLYLRTVLITAKEKICFKEECNCEPDYCEYAKGYYDKLNNILLDTVSKDFLFNKENIEQISKEYEICPFEFSLDLAYMSDIIICDYNYYFDPRVALQRDDVFNNNKDILLIDEAHNLEDRARNMYSPEISKEAYWEGYKLMKDINKKVSKDLRNINSKFNEIKKVMGKTDIIKEEPTEIIKSLRKFITSAEEYINENENIPKELLDIYFNSIFFIKISEIYNDNFCYFADISSTNIKIKTFLIDPSGILKQIQKNAHTSILFSATLTPLKYFRYILGGEDEDYIIKLNSPFNHDNLKVFITSDISMKYTLRELNIERVCEYINKIITTYKGNYMAFFPSYSYLEKVVEKYKEKFNMDNIIVQNKSFSEEEQLSVISQFNEDNNIILFTVVGGVFSEGIDLPLEKLIGAVIIGTGIPQVSFERNIIKNFFDGKFNSGYDFAYKYPGFNKILQSSGRVIRTEQDKGIVLLIDSRLCQASYYRLFPEHWKDFKKLNGPVKLVEEINKFWERNE